MSPMWLVDAVTLQHFGAVGRVSVLSRFLAVGSRPYWTEQVRNEILKGFAISDACKEVLACADLGTPIVVPEELLGRVVRVQIELGGGGETGEDHLGEAECIVLAEALGCGVITDDNSAYDLVDKRLGSARVHDTVDVLRSLVRSNELSASEAKLLLDGIRNSGRHLRRVHPATILEDYLR